MLMLALIQFAFKTRPEGLHICRPWLIFYLPIGYIWYKKARFINPFESLSCLIVGTNYLFFLPVQERGVG